MHSAIILRYYDTITAAVTLAQQGACLEKNVGKTRMLFQEVLRTLLQTATTADTLSCHMHHSTQLCQAVTVVLQCHLLRVMVRLELLHTMHCDRPETVTVVGAASACECCLPLRLINVHRPDML